MGLPSVLLDSASESRLFVASPSPQRAVGFQCRRHLHACLHLSPVGVFAHLLRSCEYSGGAAVHLVPRVVAPCPQCAVGFHSSAVGVARSAVEPTLIAHLLRCRRALFRLAVGANTELSGEVIAPCPQCAVGMNTYYCCRAAFHHRPFGIVHLCRRVDAAVCSYTDQSQLSVSILTPCIECAVGGDGIRVVDSGGRRPEFNAILFYGLERGGVVVVVAYLAVEVVPVAELAGIVVSTHVDFAVFCEKHRVVASCNARHLG